jgi:hypothetical protein
VTDPGMLRRVLFGMANQARARAAPSPKGEKGN